MSQIAKVAEAGTSDDLLTGHLIDPRSAALKKPTPFPLSRKDSERFLSKVGCTSDPDMCWPFLGFIHANGYGQFDLTVNGRKERHQAHRIAYSIAHGVSVGDESVCHSCDNRPCCNPNHLWLGTHADNMHDRDRKGRHYVGGPKNARKGEEHGRAKLSEADVYEIRRLFDNTPERTHELLARFGTSYMNIRSIGLRQSWRHLPEKEVA